MVEAFGIVLVISVILGLFAPAPPIHLSPKMLLNIVWTSGICIVLAIILACTGHLETAIFFGAFGEIIFCLMMWTEAPKKEKTHPYHSRYHERHQRLRMPPPIHPSELDVDWERLEQDRSSWS